MNTTNFQYELSLRIFHPSIDPAEITQKLSITPSHSYRVGDGRTTPKGGALPGTNKKSFWFCRAGKRAEGESGTLPELIRKMNERLWPSREFLSALRESGGNIEYFIGWFTDFNSGETFGWTLLKQCADLGIDLSFDVYGNEGRRDLD